MIFPCKGFHLAVIDTPLPMVNPKGHYMVNEDASHRQQVQAITTLRSERLVDNHVDEKKDEYTKASQTLQREKGKQVIHDTSTSATPNLETPYEP